MPVPVPWPGLAAPITAGDPSHMSQQARDFVKRNLVATITVPRCTAYRPRGQTKNKKRNGQSVIII